MGFSWPDRAPAPLINHLLGICPPVTLSQELQMGVRKGSRRDKEGKGITVGMLSRHGARATKGIVRACSFRPSGSTKLLLI